LLFHIYTAQIVYTVLVPFIKTSIILQYLRIFQPPWKLSFMYIGCWTVQWSMTIGYIVCLFLSIFLCTPRAKFWSPLSTGHCLNTGRIETTTGAFNVASDFLLLLLPQYEIWKLHISRRKKMGVSAVFFFAFGACITSVIRLIYSIRMAQSGDISYNVALLGTCTLAEMSIGIVCCCMPVFPRFFQVVGTKVRTFASTTFSMKAFKFRTSRNIRKSTTEASESVAKNFAQDVERQVERKYEMLEDNELQHMRPA